MTSPRFFVFNRSESLSAYSMSALRPAVFLDRDGTLNLQVVRAGKPYPPATLAEFALFPGVPEACAQLAAAGYVLVVATNQPDVGRGDQAQSVVESMHARLRELVPAITHIEVCYAPGQGVAHAQLGAGERRSSQEPEHAVTCFHLGVGRVVCPRDVSDHEFALRLR